MPKDIQLHVFVDGSEDAFAAVAYWRTVNENNMVEVSFVCSKPKCAPLKAMTIPRIELQAAVLGSRLTKTILEGHSVHVSRQVLWSDSATVIKWLHSEHRRYKPFVAHRVAEILAKTEQSNWRWVPTNDNPADDATRSKRRMSLSTSSRWFRGPTFLERPEDSWPADAMVIDTGDVEEELRPKYSLIVVSNSLIDLDRISSFKRLKRIIAWALRFIDRCRRTQNHNGAEGLTAAELMAAEKQLCRQVQQQSFGAEIVIIERGLPLPEKSELFELMPYIDSEKLLRVYGRIDAASWLAYAARRPIILPSVHPFTMLLVDHYHKEMKHQNTEAAICEIRRKFWIPRLRQVIRRVINNCIVCKILRAKPVAPVMGSLPEDRVTPFVRPFTFTGLDYLGPLTVSVGRRCEKRWIALFTCLTVRAIHLEVAHDLSTDACIVVLRNFINRRGVPSRIRSDNGKNFVGADMEARRFPEVFDCRRIQDELAVKDVEWVFNCPNNPSEGGVWERLVRCVKRVLLHTLKETTPREHTLHCVIVEAENIVNSRPLTHLPVTADEEEPLTPNHFLLGSANIPQTPITSEPDIKMCTLRKQWRIARQLRDRFWKKWILEYLPTLTRRVKWCRRTIPMQEGDLVLICDASVPRQQWRRGKVQRVYRGVDGEVRRADVLTSSGLLRRPVSKLAVLDLEKSGSDRSTGGGVL